MKNVTKCKWLGDGHNDCYIIYYILKETDHNISFNNTSNSYMLEMAQKY